VTTNAGEATLDAEWSSAAAPSAAIVMATCADAATSGLLIAIQNLINGSTPPAIISLSYLNCEAHLGAAGNAAYAAIYQQGVAEGTSIFVSAGDQGAAQCDYKTADVTHGINVNGLGSTPYNVAVGGTDFGDTYAGTNSTYWNSTNSPTWGSALSYVPEIPWNYTCASGLLASYEGFATTFGAAGSCNSGGNVGGLLEPWAGGGGPSGCATCAVSIPGVVSGTCHGYPKPAWQTGECSAFLMMACAIFLMCRCSPPKDRGVILSSSVTPATASSARITTAGPTNLRLVLLPPRRSWPESRRS
jgi:hypothetical protein